MMARPKGSKNKVTKDAKEALQSFLSDNVDTFKRRMSELNNVDYCRLYVKMLSYVVPRPMIEDPWCEDTPITVVMPGRTQTGRTE